MFKGCIIQFDFFMNILAIAIINEIHSTVSIVNYTISSCSTVIVLKWMLTSKQKNARLNKYKCVSSPRIMVGVQAMNAIVCFENLRSLQLLFGLWESVNWTCTIVEHLKIVTLNKSKGDMMCILSHHSAPISCHYCISLTQL